MDFFVLLEIVNKQTVVIVNLIMKNVVTLNEMLILAPKQKIFVIS